MEQNRTTVLGRMDPTESSKTRQNLPSTRDFAKRTQWQIQARAPATDRIFPNPNNPEQTRTNAGKCKTKPTSAEGGEPRASQRNKLDLSRDRVEEHRRAGAAQGAGVEHARAP